MSAKSPATCKRRRSSALLVVGAADEWGGRTVLTESATVFPSDLQLGFDFGEKPLHGVLAEA
jgi:hypothetical protein